MPDNLVNPLASLGIEIDEILGWEDGPSLFTGRDAAGQHYLAIQATRSSASRSWLCAPVSGVALRFVLGGRAQLRDAFRHTQTGVVSLVSIDRTGRVTESTRLSTDLSDDMLPAEGERLAPVA